MAYTHLQYGVRMDGQAVSTAPGASGDPAFPTVGTRFGNPWVNGAAGLSVTYNTGGFGCHQWTVPCVPHRIVRVGVETDANLANPQNLIFTVHPGAGSATGPAFTMMLPTTTATGSQCIKTVTNYVLANPGQRVRTSVSTAISSVKAKVYLWVEPVWEEVANVTDATSPTA